MALAAGLLASVITTAGCSRNDGAATTRTLAVALESPASGASVNGRVPVRVKARGATVATVLVDGLPLGDVAVGATLEWDTATVSEGAHQVLATVTRGSEQASADAMVVVDRTPPALVAVVPAGVVPAEWDGVVVLGFSEPVPLLALAVPAITVVDEFGAAVPFQAVVAAPGDALELRMEPRLANRITIALPAIADAAGNVLPASTRDLEIPPPELLTSPPDGATLFARGAVVLEATLLSGAVWAIEIDAPGLAVSFSAPPYRAVWDTTAVPEGAHAVHFVARRGAETFESTATVVVDRTPPRVVAVTPRDGERDVRCWTPARFELSERVRADTVIPSVRNVGDCGAGYTTIDPEGRAIEVRSGGAPCHDDVTVGAPLADLAGNVIAEPAHVAFTRPAWARLGGDLEAYQWTSGVGPSVAILDGGLPAVALTESDGGYSSPPRVGVLRWAWDHWERLPDLRETYGFGSMSDAVVARVLTGSAFFVAAEAYTPADGLQVYAFLWNTESWKQVGGPIGVDPARDANGPISATEDGKRGFWVGWKEFGSTPTGYSSGAYVQHWDGTAWATPHELHTPGAVSPYDPRLASNLDGAVAAAWYEWVNPGAAQLRRAFFERFADGAWTPLGSPATPGVDSTCPDVAMARDGVVTGAWAEVTASKVSLYAARYAGTGWEWIGGAVGEAPAGQSIGCPRVAVDDAGVTWVAYAVQDDTTSLRSLWVKHWNGTAWEDSGVVDTDPALDVSYWADLAARAGTVAVAFSQNDGTNGWDAEVAVDNHRPATF